MPESFKVMVKELQALALDIRVLNQNGEEVNLSALCNEDDQPAYRRRAPRTERDPDEEDIERATGQFVETGDLSDSYLVEKNEMNPEEEYSDETDYGAAEQDGDDSVRTATTSDSARFRIPAAGEVPGAGCSIIE